MASSRLFPLLFAGLLGSVCAHQDMRVQPETYCVTYLSTYLVPISTASSESASGEISKSFSSENVLVTTSIQPELQTTASEPIPEPTEPGPALLDIILRVDPISRDNKRDQRLERRALGGFVGSDSGICLEAAQFDLQDGSLIYGGFSIYYNGEDFKSLIGQPGRVPRRAITTTFSVDSSGFIRFSSSLLPNGEAGFCQVPDSGEVYVTFTSSPPGCTSVRLTVVDFQDCSDQNTPSSSTAINLASSSISEPMVPVETSLIDASVTRSSFPSQMTFPGEPSSVTVPSEFIPPFSTEVPQTQRLPTNSFRFTNTSATTMNFPVPATQSTRISFITFETSAETTAAFSFPISNSIPTTFDLSTDVEIATEITSIAEETTSVIDSTTDTTSIVEETTPIIEETTSVIESSTAEATSNILSTTETTSEISVTTTDAFTTSDAETTTTTAEETTTTAEETTTTTAEETTAVPPGACSRILAAPTPIFGTDTRDDANMQVDLPFAISAFGGSGSTIYVSINGFINVNDATGANTYFNEQLPSENIGSIAILPYWDDLAILGDGQDRIEYEVRGNDGERTITINWCVKTLSMLGAQSNQFTATFYENDPGIALFEYYKTTQRGSSATIGGQNRDENRALEYAFNTAGSVADMSFVRLDLNGGGSVTTGSF
ncbi:uncharacterized protein B0J16DRAFT_416630 [Fusarium flagelliforme]|uniref:uncharacterized protein n=1 Tax=Fusarium flagelliforme TaxID=2675880 RepID=UPI001E8E1D0E|nr:uncharacterized protein B0J16DRAFT_416630 [Fusarium flagelliforme]KAH7183586.1 hypothetical protein B0J16DRAFT_416630 [Fusarium flagelliforme]